MFPSGLCPGSAAGAARVAGSGVVLFTSVAETYAITELKRVAVGEVTSTFHLPAS